jgi:beta-ureidopropionase / N-carbamoyl-L-amino-acid hydrolase
VSVAGNDVYNLATVVLAAIIFEPCKDGVSHNELEDATQPTAPPAPMR